MMHCDPARMIQDALRADRHAALSLRVMLRDQGRSGHPAEPILDAIANPQDDPAARLMIASVAFEAAVRITLGAEHGPNARQDRVTVPDHLLLLHERLPWDPPDRQGHPHMHVEWRAAMRDGAARLVAYRLPVPVALPGARLLGTLFDASAHRDEFAWLLLGDKPRDETLDPVATGANFLSQAFPGFVDLDAELRDLRERRIACDTATAPA